MRLALPLLLFRPRRPLARGAAWLATLLALLVLASLPARAQSLLRDAETERFLHDVSRPIFEAAGLKPRAVDFYLVGDPSINAFVTGGQNIFVHSGLILAADNVDQLVGVIAHETGHITGGHLVRFDDGIKGARNISILSMLAGVAAMVAGAGDAGVAILSAGQSAAQGNFLAYSRVQEAAADQAGADFLDRAGISGEGYLGFFRKLQEQEFRYGYTMDAYARSHPLTGDRIAKLEERVKASPVYAKPADPALQERFLRIKAKLAGYVNDPGLTFQQYPPSDTSPAARLARTYAYHKQANREKAVAEIDALLAVYPDDPYVLEIKAQVLMESGDVINAIPTLRRAVALAPAEPLIATTLGHALVASENAADLPEAIAILRRVIALDDENPFAWYQLGMAYSRSGDEPRAALATAERLSMSQGNARDIAQSAQVAMRGLPQGTPDWIRAQDLLLIAQETLKTQQGRRRG
ncbi:M48 family metalloprotease [Parapedomonas caeni]